MSLSITINNINDLTDTEREVLRYVLDGVPLTDELRERRVTLTGPTVTQRFIEAMSRGESFKGAHGTFTPVAAPAAPATFAAVVHKDGDPNNHSVENLEVRHLPTAAPIPSSATAGTGAELDSAGLPWDKRIHSSSCAKVADGSWRKLRGVDDALVATVEAELRAVQAIPVPVAAQPAMTPEAQDAAAVKQDTAPAELPPVPPAPAYDAPAAPAAAAAYAAVITPVPVPPAPIATVAEMQAKLDAAVGAPLTFADLMKHVTPMLVSGKLPQDTLLAVTAEFGLPHLAALGARPDLVEAVRARIDEVVGGVA